MPNRLVDATSPYLRQHADNPVDWFPWGDEAFEKARREDKPVFLSVGYSSCHWCHVMAHDSFEDPAVAALMNARYVCVKLDREERPDVDEAYMAFVQMATGRGGWPMSVFLTPDRRPFYGGTYWPKARFTAILDHLADAWREQRDEVAAEADRIGGELARYFATPSPDPLGVLDPALYTAALGEQTRTFDPERGGFGDAPKFPPHTAIDLFLNLSLSAFADDEERQTALAMAFVTLEKMVLGGLHDHVGGGFHRYSTDREWLVPHFEKMLYDNALMLGNLAGAAALAAEIDPKRSALFARAAGGIVAWLDREMTSPEGLFYSALDADSLDEHGHSEEGAFYVWPYDDLPPAFAEAYGARPDGNFRDEATGVVTGANILHLAEDVGDAFDPVLDDLLARRAARPRPGLDDKCIVAWNGLMIGALADAGLAEPAERAANAILAAESLPLSGGGGQGGVRKGPSPHHRPRPAPRRSLPRRHRRPRRRPLQAREPARISRPVAQGDGLPGPRDGDGSDDDPRLRGARHRRLSRHVRRPRNPLRPHPPVLRRTPAQRQRPRVARPRRDGRDRPREAARRRPPRHDGARPHFHRGPLRGGNPAPKPPPLRRGRAGWG